MGSRDVKIALRRAIAGVKADEAARELERIAKDNGGSLSPETVVDAAKLDQENARLRADSDRLEWLLLNVSGEEFRRLGIVYSAGCQRTDIDEAMCEQDASLYDANSN